MDDLDFNIFDEPDTDDLPGIDLQIATSSHSIPQASSDSTNVDFDTVASVISANVPLGIIASVDIDTDDTNDLPDFEKLIENFGDNEALKFDQY